MLPFIVYYRQYIILMYKNWKVLFRSKKSTGFQILQPLFWMLTLTLYDLFLPLDAYFDKEAISNVYHFDSEPVVYPTCALYGGLNCIDFVYNEKNNTVVQSLVAGIMADYNISTSSVKGFDTRDQLNDYLFNTDDSVLYGLIFNVSDLYTPLNPFPAYSGLYVAINYTAYDKPDEANIYVVLPVTADITRRLMVIDGNYTSEATAPKITIDTIQMPHPFILNSDVAELYGPTFYIIMLLFPIIIFQVQLVREKENRIRYLLNMYGVSTIIYYLSWFTVETIFSAITALEVTIWGWVMQYPFFVYNNLILVFSYIMIARGSIVAVGFLFHSFVNRVRTAAVLGFAVVLIYLIMSDYVTLIIFSEDSSEYFTVAASLISPMLAIDGFYTFSDLADREGFYGGLHFDNLFTHRDAWPMGVVFLMLLFDSMLYVLIGVYLMNVVPSPVGPAKTPWFFLTPSFYLGGENIFSKYFRSLWQFYIPEHEGNGQLSEDEDVLEEAQKVKEKLFEKKPLVIHGLSKSFKSYGMRWKPPFVKFENFHALNSVFFHINKGEVFGLLGPNGAGKTTLINILTGLYKASKGNARIMGLDLSHSLDNVRAKVGVCPQHDILWEELTIREHIFIFSVLKKLNWSKISRNTERIIESVDLMGAANKRVEQLSGGMRRRLSIALSLIGDPELIAMDEPTTGLDPVTRYKIWDIIKAVRKRSVVLLTTHSMEEAQLIAGRIAILANGSVRCLGTSVHLRNKFGGGYRFRMVSKDKAKIEAVRELLTQKFDGLSFNVMTDTSMVCETPKTNIKQTVKIAKLLKKEVVGERLLDFSISQSTMTEVFLQIAEEARGEVKGGKVVTGKHEKMLPGDAVEPEPEPGTELAPESGLESVEMHEMDAAVEDHSDVDLSDE